MTDRDPLPLVVLDDDPTGTQAVACVPVLLEWDAELVARVASNASAVHLLTNSRAFPPDRAYALTRDGAEAAVAALGSPRLALRGDSTLRAHLLEEYRAVCDAAYPDRTPPLLLVPALPHAGRITIDGVHLLERDGRREPLHETEYATDPNFAYPDARLIQWADDRSDGFFRRETGREIPLERLRTTAGRAVRDELLSLARSGVPGVCAPDAETLDDLVLIARGLRDAEAAGTDVVIRCAPAFAGVAAGTLARARVAPPTAGGRLLVVCGSWVPSSSSQLATLLQAHPDAHVEVDVLALASTRPDREVERAAAEASRLLAAEKLAVVSTPRSRPKGTEDFEAGQRIASNLARIVPHLEPPPEVVLAKGGITSHVTAHIGLGARSGLVLGPLVDGVALWRLDGADGRAVHYVVFPGNVGTERTLLDVVDLILSA